MTDPDLFKFDVRIRERMIRRGLVSDSDIARHLEGLADMEAKSEEVPQHQPALGPGATRELLEGDDDDEDDDEEAS